MKKDEVANPRANLAELGAGAMPRVALIEDDEQQQRIYVSALEAAGYEVKVWGSAGGATNEIRTWNADAVVVDAKLRGLQGDSFIHVAKKNLRPGVYFLLHSAIDPSDLIRIARLCDCDCIPKDGEARGLIRRLKAFFDPGAAR
jgi:DNA-binding response OmpR family regulator